MIKLFKGLAELLSSDTIYCGYGAYEQQDVVKSY